MDIMARKPASDMDPAEVVMQQALARQQPMLAAMARGDSELQRFYSGGTALVTGATGFLGKLLVEKLLRACNIDKVYVLVRAKKGKTIGERIKAYSKDNVFDTLREIQPDFGSKIEPIEGNVAEIRLGISEQDWITITEQVDCIFHLAATTRFDAPLYQATMINIRGTREIIGLAKQCKKLRFFVHVSTAYSQATESKIGGDVLEQFYPSPIAPEAMIATAESMDFDRLNAITEKLINDWPNTYTFTKAIAEDLVRTHIGDLPACVVRPPVVIASYLEPAPGWLDPSCAYGAAGWYLGVGIGAMHVSLFNYIKACMVPADFVTNATLATGRETYLKHKNGETELKIYTISSRSTVSLGLVAETLRSKRARSVVSPKSVWYSGSLETNNKFVYWLLTWLFHYIPAYIVDAIFLLLGLKLPEGIPSVVKIYEKIYKTSMLLSFFLLNEWTFRDDNTVAMYNRMSATDKALFNFDVEQIDWRENLIIYGLGIRKYIVKDGLKGTKLGVRKQFWFKILTYIILPLYAYCIFRIVAFCFSSIRYVL